MKILRSIKTIGALALILGLGASLALAVMPAANILPIQSKPHGMTYNQWGDAYCRWTMSIPYETNPLLDTTGEFAAEGQSGPVWFLAGTSDPGNVERTVTVPAGKALFIPVYSMLWINIPFLGDNPWSAEQEAYARGVVAEIVDSVQFTLACEIDGMPVLDIGSYRSPTLPGDAFMVDLPTQDAWGLWDQGLPLPGTYGPSVQDGFYLMVTPLRPGQHTIHFTDGIYDVTYNLTVGK